VINKTKTYLADYVKLLQELGTFDILPAFTYKKTAKLTKAQRAHILLRDKSKEWYAAKYGCHPETVQRHWRADARRKRLEAEGSAQ
jgi:uncharacterized protein YecT (DUF1311 family)